MQLDKAAMRNFEGLQVFRFGVSASNNLVEVMHIYIFVN